MLLHPSSWTNLKAEACIIYNRPCPSWVVDLVERLIPLSRVLLEKQKGPHLVKEFPPCCETLRFTTCAQQPAISPCAQPDQSSLRSTNQFFFTIHSDVIFPYTPRLYLCKYVPFKFTSHLLCSFPQFREMQSAMRAGLLRLSRVSLFYYHQNNL